MRTQQWIRAGVLSCALLIMSLLSFAQFRVIGYMPSWSGDVNAVQYSKLTHINYAFVLPTATGGLQGVDNPSKLQSLVSLAHANGVKVLISIGGWNNGDDSGFESLAGNSSYRTNFTTSVMNFVNQYNLDGADIDWEYPDPGASANNYLALMTQLATALHAQGKLLTAAVVGTGGEGVLSSVFSQVDFLNLMAYDYNNYDHSTYAYASQSISYWKGRGLPANKTVLGVPFYGRPSWESYAALIARGASPYADTYSGVGYNGITTIKSKTDLAWDQGGGIMMWELSQDAVGTYSLLSAIHDEVVVKGGGGGGNKAPVVNITSPAGGASFNAPASVTITASASDPDGSVTKVEFYNGSVKLGEATSSPYSYTWTNVGAGNYTLSAKATDNAGAVTTSATIAIVVNGTGGGNTCDGIAAWSASAVYTANMQVVYNSKIYTAKWWTQNEQPDTHTGDGQVWKYERDCGGGTNPGNTSPVVSITSPAGGASFTAPASVTITASASDADGSIAKVAFYNGSTKLGEASSAPYSYTWTNVAAGSYTLTAIATDNGGATTTSAGVNISVNGSGGGTGNCAGVATYAPYPAVYNIGDKVVYNGYLYESLANGLYNVTPGTADYWWKPLGACSSSAKVAVANVKSVSPAPVAKALVVYPNPVTGSTLQIQVNAAVAEKIYVEIWGIKGERPVLRKEYVGNAKGQQLISIDISAVPQGTWIIKTVNAAGTRKESAKMIRM
ncbi:glycosyl hydrolase family 18 protein [Chitinophaga sp. CF418]|uniref:glycosyl hydrolase family 18 protein n=1 Tax=Chitinophaga sp. CF418 TaxID=1855287 RepID=UPI000910E659|nr:glycosyl hydrolase family 18 protein [Chitinophaga sp. CF418]SHM73086.1 Por secretion system C-terminal sorting domain-containing protein [Chitinophaga sp. CF418]